MFKEQMWKARCWLGQPKSKVRVQNTEGRAEAKYDEKIRMCNLWWLSSLVV